MLHARFIDAVVHVSGSDIVCPAYKLRISPVAHRDAVELRIEHIEVVGVVAKDDHLIRIPADQLQHSEDAPLLVIVLEHQVFRLESEVPECVLESQLLLVLLWDRDIHFVNGVSVGRIIILIDDVSRRLLAGPDLVIEFKAVGLDPDRIVIGDKHAVSEIYGLAVDCKSFLIVDRLIFNHFSVNDDAVTTVADHICKTVRSAEGLGLIERATGAYAHKVARLLQLYHRLLG